MINEKFDTDLDDMMDCYQVGNNVSGSSFGLPTPKTFREWLEKGNHEIIYSCFKTNKFSAFSNIIIFITYNQADFFFFLVLRNIDC